jgi:putative transposase
MPASCDAARQSHAGSRFSFKDGDQDVYRDRLAEQTRKRGVQVWAYRLMPNHVHLIVVPSDERGLGPPLARRTGATPIS